MLNRIYHFIFFNLDRILYLAITILWLFSALIVQSVQVGPYDYLGLVGKLPPLYFIGFSLLIIMVLNMIRKYNLKDLPIIIILLTLYLYGIVLFIGPNAREPGSYYPTAMASQIMSAGGIQPNFAGSEIYLQYPGFALFTAIFSLISQIELPSIAKYFPMIILLATSLIAIYIFKRLLNDKRFVIFASLFFTLFAWFEVCYQPSYIIYFLVFIFFDIFVIGQSQNFRKTFLLLIITYLGINIWHPLGAYFVISFLIILSIGEHVVSRHITFKYLLVSTIMIFILLLIYSATVFLEGSIYTIADYYSSLSTLLFSLTLNRESISGTVTKMAVSYSTLVFFVIAFLGVIAFFALLILTQRRHIRKYLGENKSILIIICWIISSVSLLPLVYNGEIIWRMYYFALPAICFALCFSFLTLSKRSKFVIVILLLLLIPTNLILFSGDESFKITQNTDLAPASFFVEHTAVNSKFFDQWGWSYVYYFDPYRDGYSFETTLWFPPSNFNINGDFQFIIHTQIAHNALIAYTQHDVILDNINQINLQFNRVYDNGKGFIYSRL